MRPAGARGSEAASVEDAAHPTGERRASCLRVDPLDAREPLWREVNKSPAHCTSASESAFQNKISSPSSGIPWKIWAAQGSIRKMQHFVLFLIILAFFFNTY